MPWISFAGWPHSIPLGGGTNCIQHALAAPGGLLLLLPVQQLVTLFVELVSDPIPPLVNGCDPPKEPAPLLRALVADPSQSTERELNTLAPLECLSHLLENDIKNAHRIPTGQTPLAQLVNQIGSA